MELCEDCEADFKNPFYRDSSINIIIDDTCLHSNIPSSFKVVLTLEPKDVMGGVMFSTRVWVGLGWSVYLHPLCPARGAGHQTPPIDTPLFCFYINLKYIYDYKL